MGKMIKMRRRCEEAMSDKVALSPIYYRRTFDIGADVRLVDPVRNYDVSDGRIDPAERDVCGDEWEFSYDVAAMRLSAQCSVICSALFTPIKKIALARGHVPSSGVLSPIMPSSS